ncbi:MAG TPA: hypothetical protein VIY47_14880, partial [Ignavibacteriaceae bacterium]
MTKTIIRSQHSGSIGFIIALFNLVRRIVLFPVALSASKIITIENFICSFVHWRQSFPVLSYY